MSITSFVKEKDVRAIVKVMRPPPPHKLGVPLIVLSRSNRQSLIGTAFDYLLRFELERRARWAVVGKWIAEAAVEKLQALAAAETLTTLSAEGNRLRAIIESARDAHCHYIARCSVTRRQKEEVAEWAIELLSNVVDGRRLKKAACLG